MAKIGKPIRVLTKIEFLSSYPNYFVKCNRIAILYYVSF